MSIGNEFQADGAETAKKAIKGLTVFYLSVVEQVDVTLVVEVRAFVRRRTVISRPVAVVSSTT